MKNVKSSYPAFVRPRLPKKSSVTMPGWRIMRRLVSLERHSVGSKRFPRKFRRTGDSCGKLCSTAIQDLAQRLGVPSSILSMHAIADLICTH